MPSGSNSGIGQSSSPSRCKPSGGIGDLGWRNNDEARMTNDEGSPDAQTTKERSDTSFRHSDFVIHSCFVIRHFFLLAANFFPSALATAGGTKLETSPPKRAISFTRRELK